MQKAAGHHRSAGLKETDLAPLVAVAIDDNKNSQHALKWAADHILMRGQIFFLLHIRQKISSIQTPTGQQLSISEVDNDVASAFLEKMDLQTKELLLPFQCFCERRGLQCKEVILDGTDVPKAIVDFTSNQTIDKLILGASCKNALIRALKPADVATTVLKTAPEFCSVYVISKGKLSSTRRATHPITRRSACEFESDTAKIQFQSIKSEPGSRYHTGAPARFHPTAIEYGGDNGPFEKSYGARIGEKINRDGHPDHLDFSYQSVASCPSPSRTSFNQSSNYVPWGFCHTGEPQSSMSNASNEHSFHNFHDEQQKILSSNKSTSPYWSSGSRSSSCEHSSWISKEESDSLSNHSMEDIEAKMRRLKFELRQMKDMSEDTCKEAIYMKAGGELRMEETRLSGEMMPHVTEKENSKPLLQRKFSDCFSSNIRYRRYTVEEIQKATNNFSDALKIGEGGYGPVYKCKLDHTVVAIKVLGSDPAQGMKQFHQEVEVLSCIRHPNMVLLMGACPEYGCLVYEHMPNGNLEERLFCQNGTPPLSWQLRFRIAAEIATGLLFLHQTRPEPLVHRDLKPGNILLGQNFVSKIADVGLAHLIPPAAGSATTQYCMTAAAGTFCYIDPEYQTTGLLCVKSDIYALGIILLQMITARSPMGLAHNVENALENGTLGDLLDPNVPDWPMQDTVKLAELALKCAELRRKDRPDLAHVVLPMLKRLQDVAASAEDTLWNHQQQRHGSFRMAC